jgi:hypothetical protein
MGMRDGMESHSSEPPLLSLCVYDGTVRVCRSSLLSCSALLELWCTRDTVRTSVMRMVQLLFIRSSRAAGKRP